MMKIRPIDQINHIRLLLKLGQLSYDQALILALPHIREMEKSAELIARRFGRKPPKFSFTSLMR